MKADNTIYLDEMNLRYIIVHQINNLDEIIKEAFKDVVFTLYQIEDITNIFQLDIIYISQNNSRKLGIVEIRVFNMPYDPIREFENAILDVDDILEVCKTYDSYKLNENQEFLVALFNIEMKIREIYTVLARLGSINLKNSRMRLLKDYQDKEEDFKKRLMNELFFIEFSDYKNLDYKKKLSFTDLIDIHREVDNINYLLPKIHELLNPAMGLEERFNKLSRIPEAIGRLESLRNTIAHNRYLLFEDIENFRKAKDIIDEVYYAYIEKIKNNEL